MKVREIRIIDDNSVEFPDTVLDLEEGEQIQDDRHTLAIISIDEKHQIAYAEYVN